MLGFLRKKSYLKENSFTYRYKNLKLQIGIYLTAKMTQKTGEC